MLYADYMSTTKKIESQKLHVQTTLIIMLLANYRSTTRAQNAVYGQRKL